MHATITIDRPRRRARRGLLAVTALAALALPASASAATVDVSGTTVTYSAGSGELNSLTVREVGNAVELTDSGQFVRVSSPSSFCRPLASNSVRCGLRPRRLDAFLGANDDSAKVQASFPVVVFGQAGDDRYNGGESAFVSVAEFRGGDGQDAALYGGSGVGVRVSNDGQAGDGRIGIDAENIDRDVEEIVGSNFADELTGASAPSQSLLNGLRGDDALRDQTGAFTTFSLGSAADGADRIIGDRSSTVNYSGRTRAVHVTPNSGGADDGEPGEGDEMIGDIQNLLGGEGFDTIRAPAGSTAAFFLGGRGGGDELVGGDGPDTLVGGAGADGFQANGGDDRIFANDSVREFVFCGGGTDTAELDGFDVTSACENVQVGVLRLTPKALRARAGEPARLRLSWRHPRSWRQLRRVELRLVHANTAVGEVTIRPRGRRVRAEGAVQLVRRATRITRKDKTVSARLGLRLDRSLAGRRLRLEVEAVDVRGGRQLEPRAGSIRVRR